MRKNNLIIIEGPDRAGKGTLIDTLRNQIKSPFVAVIHSSKPPKNTDNPRDWSYMYNHNLLSTIKRIDNNDFIILDRSYIGEYVYGPIYRDVKYQLEDFKEIDKWITGRLADQYNIMLITIVDNPNALLQRSDGLSNSEYISDICKEVEQFKELHYYSEIKHKLLINWRHVSEPFDIHLKNQAKYILETLQKENEKNG